MNFLNKIYISYGTDIFVPGKSVFDFSNYSRRPRIAKTKAPNGCLWASPIDAKNSWKSFVINEFPERKKSLKHSFSFRLKKSAKILVIESSKDLIHMKDSGLLHMNGLYPELDFFNIHKSYDGMYVKYFDVDDDDLYYRFTSSYDCDSIVIWNDSCVIPEKK